MDTAPRIIGAVGRLGLDRRHVAIVLKLGTGDNAAAFHWKRDAAGRFSLHDETDSSHRPGAGA